MMKVKTTRFGELAIADDRVIEFKDGLLGFSNSHRFCLLEPADDPIFFWLQSIEDPALAFVITDPSFHVTGYSVPVSRQQMGELGLTTLNDAQVFVIVNKHGDELTGNLVGPLVVNCPARQGRQLVLAGAEYSTRHVLMRVGRNPR